MALGPHLHLIFLLALEPVVGNHHPRTQDRCDSRVTTVYLPQASPSTHLSISQQGRLPTGQAQRFIARHAKGYTMEVLQN